MSESEQCLMGLACAPANSRFETNLGTKRKSDLLLQSALRCVGFRLRGREVGLGHWAMRFAAGLQTFRVGLI